MRVFGVDVEFGPRRNSCRCCHLKKKKENSPNRNTEGQTGERGRASHLYLTDDSRHNAPLHGTIGINKQPGRLYVVFLHEFVLLLRDSVQTQLQLLTVSVKLV